MGDGYTAAEMDKWHADAKRLTDILFAASPFKERRQRLQRVGGRHAFGRERGGAAVGRRLPPHRRCARPTTRSAPSATCWPSTTSGCARRRRRRPTSSSRSWSTTASTAAAASTTSTRRCPPTTRSRPTCSCTSSAITSPAWPTSTTRRPSRYESAARHGRSRGSRTRPPTRRRRKWKDLVAAGTPLPTPWQKDEFEAKQRDSRPGGGRSARTSGPRRRWRRCSAKEREQ